MKIAFIVSTFPAVSETFILNQITGMIDLGHKVSILVDKQTNPAVIHNDIRKYNLIDYTIYGEELPPNKIIRIIKFICSFTKISFCFPHKALKILHTM